MRENSNSGGAHDRSHGQLGDLDFYPSVRMKSLGGLLGIVTGFIVFAHMVPGLALGLNFVGELFVFIPLFYGLVIGGRELGHTLGKVARRALGTPTTQASSAVGVLGVLVILFGGIATGAWRDIPVFLAFVYGGASLGVVVGYVIRRLRNQDQDTDVVA